MGTDLLEKSVLESGNLVRLYDDLGKIEDVLRDSGPVLDDSGQRVGSSIGVHEDDPEKTREFLKMLYRRSADSARETARWLDADVDGTRLKTAQCTHKSSKIGLNQTFGPIS